MLAPVEPTHTHTHTHSISPFWRRGGRAGSRLDPLSLFLSLLVFSIRNRSALILNLASPHAHAHAHALFASHHPAATGPPKRRLCCNHNLQSQHNIDPTCPWPCHLLTLASIGFGNFLSFWPPLPRRHAATHPHTQTGRPASQTDPNPHLFPLFCLDAFRSALFSFRSSILVQLVQLAPKNTYKEASFPLQSHLSPFSSLQPSSPAKLSVRTHTIFISSFDLAVSIMLSAHSDRTGVVSSYDGGGSDC